MKRKDFSKLKVEVQEEKSFHFEHENYIAGLAPYLRGIFSSMYMQEPLKTTISNNIPFPENIPPEIELSNFLTKSLHFIQTRIKENTLIDQCVSTLVFHTTVSENHFDEITKMRAARILWANLIKLFNAKNQDSLALNIHAYANNYLNTLTVILGGCQTLTSKDKSYLFFEEETNILKTVDPWAGSFYIEKRTADIANKAWLLFSRENNM